MKRYALQASSVGGGLPTRFLTTYCQNVDHLLGQELLLLMSQQHDHADTTSIMLYTKGSDGSTPQPAAKVVSSSTKESGQFAIIHLQVQDFRRLFFMRKATVCLSEVMFDTVYDLGEDDTVKINESRGGITADVEAQAPRQVYKESSSVRHGGEGVDHKMAANEAVARTQGRVGSDSKDDSTSMDLGSTSEDQASSPTVGQDATKSTSWETKMNLSSSSSSDSDELVLLSPTNKKKDATRTSRCNEPTTGATRFDFGNSSRADTTSRVGGKPVIVQTGHAADGVEVMAIDKDDGPSSLRMSPQKRPHHGQGVMNSQDGAPYDERSTATGSQGTDMSPSIPKSFSNLADTVTAKRTKRDEMESSLCRTGERYYVPPTDANKTPMADKVAHDEDPLSQQDSRNAAASTGESGPTEKSYADATRGGSNESGSTPRQLTGNHGHDEPANLPTAKPSSVGNKKPGLFERGIIAVSSFFGAKSPKMKKAAFELPRDWDDYARLASGFHLSVTNADKRKLSVALGSAEIVLSKENCNMPMLTLAAYMCNKCEIDTDALRSMTLERLSSMSLSLNCNRMPSGKQQLQKHSQPETRPYNVWHQFFSNLIQRKQVPRRESDDSLWIQIFSIWDICGIFRRQYQPILWRDIRDAVDGGFFGRQRVALVERLTLTRTNVLGALLRQRLDDFADFVVESAERNGGRSVLLNGFIVPHIVHLVEKYIRSMNAIPPGDSLSSFWETFLATLSFVRFPKREVIETILKKTFAAISFRSLHTFEHYGWLVDSIDSGFEFAVTACKVIQEHLRDDLCSTPEYEPTFKDVTVLFSCSTRPYLYTDMVWNALTEFTLRKMTSSASFGTKLVFIGDLYDAFSGGSSSRAIENFILECIAYAKRGVNPSKCLQVVFGLAAERPSIFCCEERMDSFLNRVSKSVCGVAECRAVLHKPEILGSLLVNNKTQARATSLLARLYEQIQEGVAMECLDFDGACHFFLGVLSAESPSSSRGMSLAVFIFTTSFWNWKPSTFNDLIAASVNSLNSMHECLLVAVANHTELSQEDSRKMQDCLEHVQRVVTDRSRNYGIEAVSKTDLEAMCHRYDHRCWQQMTEVYSVELPTLMQLTIKRQEYLELEEDILFLLRGSPDNCKIALRPIFRGYSCVVDPESAIRRLLTGYEWLEAEEQPGEATLECESTCLVSELRHLREDVDAANAFCAENSVALLLCDYFLKKPSVLFRNSVFLAMNVSPSLEHLLSVAQDAKAKMSNLLGSACTLDDVYCAVDAIHAGESTVKHEVSVLQACHLLEISEDDAQSFLVIAALADALQPMRRFVESCHQFQFAVTKDPLFGELSNMVQQLSSDESGDVSATECFHCAKRIYGILRDDGSKYIPSVICQALTGILPTLNLMACFSVHSEVWTFVREMKWLDKEGLKRFYEQYGNVTNVLLGSSASYEMSVLNAVEPTVRAISTVAGFIQEHKVSELLNSLGSHKEISDFVHTGRADIVQVQTNLSQIRDWFTCGVDELAQIHLAFEAVCKTGEYCLEPFQAIGESDADNAPDFSALLTLRYQTKESRRQLQSEELNSFVQHIGLIQNEDDASAKVLVEQHQILVRAARNVTEMESIGYGQSGKDAFSCRVGRLYVDHARELLSNSETALGQCQEWLQLIRSNRFVSLLFWNDQLHDIHKATTQAIKVDNEKVQSISHSLTSRLMRLTRGRCTRQQLHCAISYAITLRTNNTCREASSWLVDVSNFVYDVHEALNAPWRMARDGSKGRSQIMLHTMACKRDEYLRLTLRILRHVYKERLPEPFEVFDGLVDGTREKLAVFLERVKTFRSNMFTILNVEALDGKLLEIIISFLSNPGIALEGINLHLLQREGSSLHSSPWTSDVRWESDERDVDLESMWRALVLDRHIDKVSVVWSPLSGAGKSRFIQQALSESTSRHGDAETAKITIHERSSTDSLTKDLLSQFSQDAGSKNVHFNLTCLRDITEDDAMNWVECLNHFFFSLLVLNAFHLPPCLSVYVEVPNNAGESTRQSVSEWLRRNVPILLLCGTLVNPPGRLEIREETRRVCTYLRAYDNGTINRKFEPVQRKRIVFVLDVSGSMTGHKLSVATDNALNIIDTHIQVGDSLGVVLFDDTVWVQIPVETITEAGQKLQLRQRLDQVRYHNGRGTYMYAALQYALQSAANAEQNVETWVVCLTDGCSSDTDEVVRPYLEQSRDNVHLTIIGVNLNRNYENRMRLICNKYGRRAQPCKGFFVRSGADVASMNSAFEAVSRSIPVSQTFELDGAVTDEQCHYYLEKYAPDFVDRTDALLLTFWVRFIYRRVKVFDLNEDFNYNEQYESLGSTLMKAMLDEVERLLSTNQSRDWVGTDHMQLIYDFSCKDSPEFRLLCTAPEEMDTNTRLMLGELALPGFSIPTKHELSQRSTLDRYLSQSLGIPLENERIACIDANKFILTLDFTMKLLSIHERVACRSPCVIEGETGVSKTALTRMYAILRNAVVDEETKRQTNQHLEEISQELVQHGHSIPFGYVAYERLERALGEASEAVIGNETELARDLHKAILEKCACRSSVYQDVPADFSCAGEARTSVVLLFLKWFRSSALEPMFFDVNVDSSLDASDFVERFAPIRQSAKKLLGSEAVVVVFLDEFNTSSVLGLCKEIIIDHTLAGQDLESNIVVIAACNPSRKQVASRNLRERDLGKEWAGGHYQVAELPASIAKIKWSFGSLNGDQEKDFILRRLAIISDGESLPAYIRMALTEYISASQEAMRHFAARNITESLLRDQEELGEEIDLAATERARSVVSLRDIQRVFSLFDFFSTQLRISCISDAPDAEAHRNAMLLAIAIVYYLRLDGESRKQFLGTMRSLPAERGNKTDLLYVLNQAMDEVIRETEIPSGVAVTRGLKENVFVTFVCTLSRTALMIVGPPGASKTLSVNIVAENCNGEDSASPFYRKHARLALFHYQCSKQSTSKELLAIFDKAIQRQEGVDPAKHLCFVLMDEAGLPEEEKESLKVLHYLLEGHMSAKAEVGFVAISNHVLDAAKTNRCVMLLREEPDEEDMLSIASGVLFDAAGNGHTRALHVDLEGEMFPANKFALSLCQSYATMLHDTDKLAWFDTFFGLRDLIHFLKAIRSYGRWEAGKLEITLRQIVFAIERNFNGVDQRHIRLIAEIILRPLVASKMMWSPKLLDGAFREPVEVIRDALLSSNGVSSLANMTRFKLVVDQSGDDSILRLLNISGMVDVSKMFKLSRMPQDVELEELRLISGVKFAALQGKLAVLSQTESINESFYDLFNQRFQSVTGRDGQVDLYANIAVGGVSRRSLVRPEFECVIHVNESDLPLMPAPFLNRFEKFRLSIHDVLRSGWTSLGELAVPFRKSRLSLAKLASILCDGRMVGWISDEQTLDSLYVDMLPSIRPGAHMEMQASDNGTETLSELDLGEYGNLMESIADTLQNVVSLRPTIDDIRFAIEDGMKYMRLDDADSLRLMSTFEMSAQDVLHPRKETTQTSRVCLILIQMIATRATARRMLQLATPESVFASREYIPDCILHDYFMQEHFSLKRLVKSILKKAKRLSLVYTRTSASIHSIPTHNPSRDLSREDSSGAERLRKFVHDNLDELVVENLSVLKSEAMLSSSVEAFIKNDRKRVFALFVDMGSAFAPEKVNYARMLAERSVAGIANKFIVFVLHYSSSGRDGQCYPANFLGGWDHFFLDGMCSEQSVGVEYLIEAACMRGRRPGEMAQEDNDNIASRIADSVLLLLRPRILPHVASQKLFYPSQEGTGPSFVSRTKMLKDVLKTRVGDSDIAFIIASKFGKLWAEHGLFSSMTRATKALLLGTTRLSLTMSLESVLVETFDTFVSIMIRDQNQWRNLDLLLDTATDSRTLELYGLILSNLPVMPFEELVLQTKTHAVHVSPVADPRNETASVHFPFFRLVSSFLDECIEKVEQTFAEDQDLGVLFPLDGMDLFRRTTQMMQDLEDEHLAQGPSPSGRASPVLAAISFVEKDKDSCGYSLFDRYVRHFAEWRFGCNARSLLVDRLMSEVAEYGSPRNIVAIHVVGRVRSEELQKVASIVSTFDRMPFKPGTSEESHPEIPHASTGEELFAHYLEDFEATVFKDNVSNSEWCTKFITYLHQIRAMLGGKLVEDLRLASRLRILCIFWILMEASASTRVQNAVKKVWKEKDTMTTEELVEAVSLEHCLADGVGERNQTDLTVRELAMRVFFSPLWLNISMIFRDEDVSFLLDAISNDILDDVDDQLLSSLLYQVCFHGKPQPSSLTDCLDSDQMFELASRMSCDRVSSFSSDGKRICLPHFIPNWLARESVEVSSGAGLRTSLVNYGHCFNCRLSRVVYDLLLRIHLLEAEKESSESLFVGLTRCIHEETSMERLAQTRRARVGAESLIGSSLGAIVLDIRLICFAAKVSHEIAADDRAAVFCGLYSQEASQLLDELMSLKHLKVQELFIGIILHKRGEGTLATALGQNGPLSHMDWCREWARGLPEQLNAATDSLRAAENALAEALREEERKSREFHLCPFCQQPFSVAQVNCGSFVCGRDFHNGLQTGHGCGRTFQLQAAQRYEPDERLLERLRNAVTTERAIFGEHETASMLLERAREMRVPMISFRIERDLSQGSLLPCASFLSVDCNSDEERNTVALVRVLFEGSARATHFSLLPDLIEFYMWLHNTFRYLVTPKQALRLKVSETIKPSLLQRRFDLVTANHISTLWERVTSGVNEYLRAFEHKIAYECEEIEVSFNLEDAPLVALLSEGEHPTDGNDVLFLIINEIIGSYNSFAHRIAEYVSSDTQESPPLHPKFVATGCGGAVILGATVPLPSSDLTQFVASYWNSTEECYDLEGLGNALRREIGLVHLPPVISNPSKCLRERFRFRDENSRPLVDAGTYASVFIGSGEECFANNQDYRLSCDVRQGLIDNELTLGDADIRRTLSDNFFSCDYDQLRLMLEGCRSLLSLVSMEFLDFVSTDQVLRAVRSDKNSDFCASDALLSFGFPQLQPAQVQLLAMLDASQFVELVTFLSYQLASEAYIFANLPLCMTRPLHPSDCEEIESRLGSLSEDRGVTKVIELIDEFTRDILSFYEAQIRDAASSSNQSLKGFLIKENFCDDSADPVFALLPTRVSLHNYVPLRQHLHQCKLRFLSNETVASTQLKRNIDPETIDLFTRPSRGKSWLWEDDEMEDNVDSMQVDDEGHVTPYSENWSLWFETERVNEDDQEMTDVQNTDEEHPGCAQRKDEADADAGTDSNAVCEAQSMEIDEYTERIVDVERDGVEAAASVIIQRWWRAQLVEIERDDSTLDEGDYKDMFTFDDEDEDEDEKDDPNHQVIPHTVVDKEQSTETSREDAPTSELDGSPAAMQSNQTSMPVQTSHQPQQENVTEQTVDSSARQVQQMQIDNVRNDVERATEEGGTQEMEHRYGNLEEEQVMRRWLDDNRLPQTVADELMELGARNVDDVVYLVESCEELLDDTSSMKPLDRIKLCKAVKSRMNAK